MSFKMLQEAEVYFAKVDRRDDQGAKYKLKIDFYYLCLMAGLHFRELGDEQQEAKLSKAQEFVNYYPELYRDKADLIAGLLIDAEMSRKAIIPDDKKAVEQLMLDLIDHMSVTKLSKSGMDMLNLYAAGGFNKIKDRIPMTSELEVFLIKYTKLFE